MEHYLRRRYDSSISSTEVWLYCIKIPSYENNQDVCYQCDIGQRFSIVCLTDYKSQCSDDIKCIRHLYYCIFLLICVIVKQIRRLCYGFFKLFIHERERVIRDEYETQEVLILLFYVHMHVNSFPPEQNGHHFAKTYANVFSSMKILKFR